MRGPAGPRPVGARERTVEAPEPMVVRASDMKSVDDVRNALRAASDNTVVFDEALDLGFGADRIIVIPGKNIPKGFNPEKIVDSVEPPVVNQAMFANLLQYLGFK